MKPCLLLLPVLACLSLGLNAATLEGRARDAETKNVIAGVTIRVLETNQATSTDKKGGFVFADLPGGTYHLVATHVAYDASDTLAVQVGQTNAVEIQLKPTPWVLNDVVVTGTRSPHLLKDVPVQTEVISQRDFQRTGAKTVDEALSSSIGINVQDDLSGKGATIRGIYGDRVLVLVDGERSMGRVNGAIDLGQYSLANVEKIEIVKGTGSTLYGSDAMGGVINVITKRPTIETTSANLYFDYGTHNSLNPSLELNYGKDRFGALFGAKYFATDGFDLDKSTPHTNGQDAIKRWNFDNKLSYRLSPRWSVTSNARYMHENREWIESEVWGKDTYIYNDDETNRRYEGSIALDFLSGDKYSMKLKAYGTLYDHQWNKFDDEFGYWVDTSDTKDKYFELGYSSNYVIGQNHVITYGADYNYQNLESNELYADTKADHAGDAYLQYEYSPIKSLNFLPGVRYEYHRSFGDKVNPSVNVMWTPSEQVKVRGFVGYGFRAPSIKQQYFVFDHTAAGYIVYGGSVPLPSDLSDGRTFSPLQEETSINSSISAELSYGTIGLHRITYYYNHLDDLIEFDLLGFTPTYWRGIYAYQNIQTAITQGIEWESRVRVTRSLDISFTYDYLYSRNLTTGDKLINRPDHTAKFFLTGHLDEIGLGATFWGSYQSRKLWVPRSNTGGNEGEADYAPHRTTLNFNLFKRLYSNTEAFLRIENILDEVDAVYGYWPGRQIFLGVKYGLQLTAATQP